MALVPIADAVPRLRSLHAESRLIPFIGAGFSIPLQLPSWSNLIEQMGSELGFETELFSMHGTFEQLAGYYAQNRGGLHTYLCDLAASFNSAEAAGRRRKSPQHIALAALRCRRIYTTNFEHHIEEALRDAGVDVRVLATLHDFGRPRDVRACEVVKFHGDLRHPETVLLTEEQYFSRFALEAAADQFLRADMLANSFLFLGYSFRDVNIRYLWFRLNQLRKLATLESGSSADEPCRSYWVSFDPGLVQPDLLHSWGIDVIALSPSDRAESVRGLLACINANAK